eukprot:8587920-Alexandrium_andersonii.AAC.1
MYCADLAVVDGACEEWAGFAAASGMVNNDSKRQLWGRTHRAQVALEEAERSAGKDYGVVLGMLLGRVRRARTTEESERRRASFA